MLSKLLTLNMTKKPDDATRIEKEFKLTRASYLRDLNKIRKKYELKLKKLIADYGSVCN